MGRLDDVFDQSSRRQGAAAATDRLVALAERIRAVERGMRSAVAKGKMGASRGSGAMPSLASRASANSRTGEELSATAVFGAVGQFGLRAGAAALGGAADALGSARRAAAAARGVYVWGGVGTGKTFCMDAFVARAVAGSTGRATDPLDPEERSASLALAERPGGAGGVRRVHHHAFLVEVLERMHRLRAAGTGGARAVDAVAAEIAAGGGGAGGGPIRVLCCDELQVYDGADACLLGQVMSGLVERGVSLVVTSNRAPEDLFSHGINRDLVKPLVAALREACDVVHLDGMGGEGAAPAQDFRRREGEPAGTVVWPGGGGGATGDIDVVARLVRCAAAMSGAGATGSSPAAAGGGEDGVRAVAAALASGRVGEAAEAAARAGLPPVDASRRVDVGFGRAVSLPAVLGGGCLLAPFPWLCGQAASLGPADFRAVFRTFPVVAVTGVPLLGYSERNEARRLITAVDVAYEEGTVLLAALAAHPDELFAQLAEQAAAGAPEGADMDEMQRLALAGAAGGGGEGGARRFEAHVVGEGGSSSAFATTMIGRPGEAFEWSATGRKGASLGDVSALADTLFAQRRTASRLVELASRRHAEGLAAARGWALPRLAGPGEA